MDGVTGYRDTNTDELLRRAMEASGDHDPSRVLADTGKALHFDATDSLDVHRAAQHPGTATALETGGVVMAGKIGGAVAYEKATGALAKQVLSPLLRAGAGAVLEGVSAIATLGTLYDEAIESAHHEGDTQRALGASDAGVVGMTQALDVSAAFKADVARAHAGSGNAAAAVRVQIESDPAMQRELQLRADRGFIAAAGYAKMAAREMAPLYAQASAKLTAAKVATPDDARKLRSEAQGLMGQAAAAEKKCLAPVLGKARDDAAYGIGVQYALHSALKAEGSGRWEPFDSAFAKASGNAQGVGPAAVRIGG